MPSNRHLVYVADFILTLRWDPFHGTVFLHTMRLAPHTCTTWLNLKSHVTWSSTTYRTPLVQLHPQQRCPGTHSESSLLWSKRVNFAIRWPLRWTSVTLWSEGFTSMSAALPSGSMVGSRMGPHLKIHTLSQEKSCLEQSIMPLNSRYFWTRILSIGSLRICPQGKV